MTYQAREFTMLHDLNIAVNTKITYKRSFDKLFDFCNNESQIEKPWYKLVSKKETEKGTLAYQQDSYEKYLQLSDDSLQRMLESFLKFEKRRVRDNLISPNSIPNHFTAYKMLLEANYREHAVKWQPIVYQYPPKEKRSGYKPWTTLRINQMIEKCDTLNKEAAIKFQTSTGSRVGVHNHPLLMKHMIKMTHPNLGSHCYAVLIYAEADETIDEKDQRILNEERDSKDYSFFAFLNPEAADALDRYHQERIDNREKITPDSPIFLGSDTHNFFPDPTKYQMSGNAFRKIMESVIKKANIQRIKKRNRYDVMIDHGFRKRFNTILKLDSEVNSNIAEKLMQHKKGLDGTYLTPTRQECFKEFVKAISELTISDNERQKLELQKKEREITDLESQKELREDIQKQLDEEKKARLASEMEMKQLYQKLREEKLENYKSEKIPS